MPGFVPIRVFEGRKESLTNRLGEEFRIPKNLHAMEARMTEKGCWVPAFRRGQIPEDQAVSTVESVQESHAAPMILENISMNQAAKNGQSSSRHIVKSLSCVQLATDAPASPMVASETEYTTSPMSDGDCESGDEDILFSGAERGPLDPKSRAQIGSTEPSLTSGVEFVPVVRSGQCADVGPRKGMEDVHIAIDDLASHEEGLLSGTTGAFYGVFDGHGGSAAAHFARNSILRHALRSPESSRGMWGDALHYAFLRTDLELHERWVESISSQQQGLQAGRTEGESRQHQQQELDEQDESGTTALTAMVIGSELIVANAGDCRAVMCRAGTAVELSRDHKATCSVERQRIVSAGGTIQGDYLNGQLNLARALGDWHLLGLKRREDRPADLVTTASIPTSNLPPRPSAPTSALASPPEPEASVPSRSLPEAASASPQVFPDTPTAPTSPATSACTLPRISGPLSPHPDIRTATLSSADEFLIMGSDGFWDRFTSQNAVRIAREQLQQHNDPAEAAQALVAEALKRETLDNVTVVLVCFGPDPPPPLVAEKERERGGGRVRRSMSVDGLRRLQQLLDQPCR